MHELIGAAKVKTQAKEDRKFRRKAAREEKDGTLSLAEAKGRGAG